LPGCPEEPVSEYSIIEAGSLPEGIGLIDANLPEEFSLVKRLDLLFKVTMGNQVKMDTCSFIFSIGAGLLHK